jgi:hypothetical protein
VPDALPVDSAFARFETATSIRARSALRPLALAAMAALRLGMISVLR